MKVRQICHIALKRDHEFINTVQEGSEETHSQVRPCNDFIFLHDQIRILTVDVLILKNMINQVRQMHLVAPLEMQFPLLYVLLKEHIANDVDYKVCLQREANALGHLHKDALSYGFPYLNLCLKIPGF